MDALFYVDYQSRTGRLLINYQYQIVSLFNLQNKLILFNYFRQSFDYFYVNWMYVQLLRYRYRYRLDRVNTIQIANQDSQTLSQLYSKQQTMSRLEQLIPQLRASAPQSFIPVWQQFLSLCAKASNNSAAIEGYLRGQILKPRDGFYRYFMEYVKLAYNKRGEPIRILYRLLPVLIQRYIQINYVKYEGLEQCFIEIYNWEFKAYNQAQLQRNQLSKDMAIRTLYQGHLGKEMIDPKVDIIEPIQQINNTSRNSLKSLIFYLVYRQANKYPDQSLTDYYRCLFIYCGADEKDLLTTGSLYLLQKINKVSIFRYSISDDELQWIILTLYELCTQVKKDKFQLLAVINVIHKKVSNQGLFRMSDVLNSVVHLLEDEYEGIFG